jgi:hypothetical protein
VPSVPSVQSVQSDLAPERACLPPACLYPQSEWSNLRPVSLCLQTV